MYKNLKKERDDKVSVQKGASDREKSKPSESSGVRLKRCLALKINCIIEIFFNYFKKQLLSPSQTYST